MSLRTLPLAALLGAVALGCGDGDDETSPPNSGPGCEPPEVTLPDGSCIRPGVGPEGCHQGFVHDGEYGCEPILPFDPCPPGLMAVPGESECRPIMACGEGAWGDLPIDSTTQHVDGSYGGGNSDGSAAAPWTTINEAVAAVAPGALVAVAAGSYVEDVLIENRPVRLWGRCPELVEIVGTGGALATVDIRGGANGSEIGGLAIVGSGGGLVLWGSENVSVERAWVHDTASRGITVQGNFGPTSLVVSGTLVEHSREVGLFVAGSEALVSATVVRGIQPDATNHTDGRGVNLSLMCSSHDSCDPTTRALTTVRQSLVEQNDGAGVIVMGTDAVIEGTVTRANRPSPIDQGDGSGLHIQSPRNGGLYDPACRANAIVRGSLIDQNHARGLAIIGADALVEGTVVRNTWPRGSDMTHGHGVDILPPCALSGCEPAMRSAATMRSSLIEHSHEVGFFVMTSDAVVEDTVVRTTSPRASDQAFGRGMAVQLTCFDGPCTPNTGANVVLRGSLVDQNHDVGLHVASSDAVVERIVVRATTPRLSDGFFGDGIVVDKTAPAGTRVFLTLIANSSRAGLANFGGTVSIGSSRIQCAGYELEGESLEGQDFSFEDLGDNGCGCPEAKGACVVESAGLAPPQPSPQPD